MEAASWVTDGAGGMRSVSPPLSDGVLRENHSGCGLNGAGAELTHFLANKHKSGRVRESPFDGILTHHFSNKFPKSYRWLL